MDTADARHAIQEIRDLIKDPHVPGATYDAPQLTPAQKRLIAKRLRQLADLIDP